MVAEGSDTKATLGDAVVARDDTQSFR